MENWSAIFSDFVQSLSPPLPFSFFLSFFLLASAVTRPLPTFVQRISFVEKFYFPLFNAIQMQNPVAVFWHRIGTSGSLSEMRYAHAYEIFLRDMDLR